MKHGADPNLIVNVTLGPGHAHPAAAYFFRYQDDFEVIEDRYIAIVQILLDFGANVNSRDGEYGSALHAAKKTGRVKIARLLEDHDAIDLAPINERPKVSISEEEDSI